MKRRAGQVPVLAIAMFVVSLVFATALLAAPNAQAPDPGAQARPADRPQHPVRQSAGRLLVRYRAGLSREAQAGSHARHGGAVMATVPGIGVDVVQVPADQMTSAIASYHGDPDVLYVEPDYIARAVSTPDDPDYQTQQYGPKIIKADLAWDVTTGSSAVTVAVVDSGVNLSHPDLQGKLSAGWDFVGNDGDPSDDYGHGTHVAGIVGAATNNGIGIAGVGYNVTIMPVKVLDSAGQGAYSVVAQGIIYAADHGARIINLSLGNTDNSSTLQDAVNYAWNSGALVVAAAGNNGNNVPFYPAAYPNAMAVAASTAYDTIWGLSNFGGYISVAAPGANVYSTDLTGGVGPYAVRSGTSQAAPHVSGVAALLLAQTSNRTNAQLRDIIQSTADDLGTSGWDQYWGFGRLNAYRAVTDNRNPAPTPTLSPTATRASTTVPTATATKTPTPRKTPTPTRTPALTPTPALQTVDDTSPTLLFNGWRGISVANASGGAYRASRVTGDTASYTFTGTSVTWYSVKGPDQGQAEAFIDGVSKGIKDNYSSGYLYTGKAAWAFSSLGSGSHTITIRVLGTKNASARDYNVALDYFYPSTKAAAQESSPLVTYDTWAGTSNTAAYGGSYRSSGDANAVAGLTFNGAGVEWVTANGPGYGIAKVYIDGVLVETVDLYAAAQAWQIRRAYSLASGQHTIEIHPTGTKNAGSTGNAVAVDGFYGQLTPVKPASPQAKNRDPGLGEPGRPLEAETGQDGVEGVR